MPFFFTHTIFDSNHWNLHHLKSLLSFTDYLLILRILRVIFLILFFVFTLTFVFQLTFQIILIMIPICLCFQSIFIVNNELAL